MEYEEIVEVALVVLQVRPLHVALHQTRDAAWYGAESKVAFETAVHVMVNVGTERAVAIVAQWDAPFGDGEPVKVDDLWVCRTILEKEGVVGNRYYRRPNICRHRYEVNLAGPLVVVRSRCLVCPSS